MYDICLTVTAWCIIGLLGVLLIFCGEIVYADIGIRDEWTAASPCTQLQAPHPSAVRSSVLTSASGTNGTRQVLHSFKRGILPLQKSTFPYICIANKGKCFCLAHYEVTIAKDTVNSQ